MIIDAILDRRAVPEAYTLRDIKYIVDEAEIFGFDYIIKAFQSDNNKAVQEALCKYIDEQNYNPEIKEFVTNIEWVL